MKTTSAGWNTMAIEIREFFKPIRRGWRGFVAFEVFCRLLNFVVYAPMSAWFLGAILRSSGDVAVFSMSAACTIAAN